MFSRRDALKSVGAAMFLPVTTLAHDNKEHAAHHDFVEIEGGIPSQVKVLAPVVLAEIESRLKPFVDFIQGKPVAEFVSQPAFASSSKDGSCHVRFTLKRARDWKETNFTEALFCTGRRVVLSPDRKREYALSSSNLNEGRRTVEWSICFWQLSGFDTGSPGSL